MPSPNVVAPTTDTPDAPAAPTSRRALLAGALGGLGALAATVIGGASRTQAAAGSPLILGSQANNAGTADTQVIANSGFVTFKLLQNGPGTGLMGYATPLSGATRGVYGRSDSPDGDGVQARNAGTAGTGAAIRAFGGNNDGVVGTSDNATAVQGNATIGTGVWGESTSGFGVFGYSPFVGMQGETTAGVGVKGAATSGIGVWGASTDDFGVYGASTNSYAGAFSGPISTTKYLDMVEISEPADPGTNTVRLFVRDNASVTELCVKIGSTVYVLAP